MDLSDLIIERILELQRQNKMNTYQLSLKSGIPRSTLSKLLSRQSKTIRLENLLYICEAFNIKLWQFFYDSRFDEVEASEWRKEKVDTTAI